MEMFNDMLQECSLPAKKEENCPRFHISEALNLHPKVDMTTLQVISTLPTCQTDDDIFIACAVKVDIIMHTESCWHAFQSTIP